MHDLAEEWVRDAPNNTRARALLATSYRKLGDARKLAGDLDAARTRYLQAIDLGRKALGDEPTNIRYKGDLAAALDDLAGVDSTQHRFEEARAEFDESERLFLQRLDADPEDVDTQLRLVLVQSRLGRLERDDARFARAVEVYRRALERLRQLESQEKLAGLPVSPPGHLRATRDWVRELSRAVEECEAAARAAR
jgi:tetratricopeptide (TPR) repeat protein